MLVKDLIRDTIWTPGKDYDPSHKPMISVLLPAFRRAKSGMFRRCVESILSQTLKDIELIIIDDASTDGTEDQTREFMQKDGRISSLRHPKNIGLPAISEYEGYLKARSDRIAFAFDDTMFNKDALENLLKESETSPHAMIYGHIEWQHRDPKSGELHDLRLGAPHSQGLLRVGNHIPNNAVLISKQIIEDVGFYDPHIIVARICDWDLWIRVAERYEVKFADVAVGREYGPITTDSLGNTYTLDSWAASEWMKIPRNEALKPKNLPNYEVLEMSQDIGTSTRTVGGSLATKHAAQRGWRKPLDASMGSSDDGYILVVTQHYDASTCLYFEMLPPEVANKVRVVTYRGGFGPEEMARATCVIFVRYIGAYHQWLDAAKALGIPMYYFLDDNFPLLQMSGEISIPQEDYSVAGLQQNLRRFDGVLLSSQALIEYFRKNLLHSNLLHFPVASYRQETLSVDFEEPKKDGELVIACAAGGHRMKGLVDQILPALSKIADEGAPIHLITGAPEDPNHKALLDNAPPNLRVTALPFNEDYLFAIRRFARYRPDLLVNPPSETVNGEYKTLHPLLTAKFIDAAAIVPATPPYDQVIGQESAILVDDSSKPMSWYGIFKRVSDRTVDLARVKQNNAYFCSKEFSGSLNVSAIRSINAKHGGEVKWSEQARRLHKLNSWTRSVSSISPEIAADDRSYDVANQISAYRRMERYSIRHRIMQRRTDLWSLVSPEFSRLKVRSAAQGWRGVRSSLELSDSLHDMDYREYLVRPPAGKLSSIEFAFSVDLVKRGIVGVEMVSPDKVIKDHVVIDLQGRELGRPVKFDLTNVHVKEGETWSIRVFAKSRAPVYVYEFINKRWLGLRFARPTPFMEITTAT